MTLRKLLDELKMNCDITEEGELSEYLEQLISRGTPKYPKVRHSKTFCPACGNPVEPIGMFCRICGQAIEWHDNSLTRTAVNYKGMKGTTLSDINNNKRIVFLQNGKIALCSNDDLIYLDDERLMMPLFFDDMNDVMVVYTCDKKLINKECNKVEHVLTDEFDKNIKSYVERVNDDKTIQYLMNKYKLEKGINIQGIYNIEWEE